MILRFNNRALACLVALAAIFGVLFTAACGSDASAASATSGGSTCFTQMDANQKAQLADYVSQQGDKLQNAGNNADGTQDICVLESDGHGGYNERNYRQDDHFSDYLMYSMLMGHSNALISYGLISGDLDLGDAMALSLLTGVNSRGGLYHPYQYTDAGWGYRPTVVNNTKVTNVYYGNSQQSFGKPAPKGYGSPKTLPTKAPDAMAGAHIGANGKGEIGKTGDKGASQTLKDAKTEPVKLPAAKQVAPAVSVPVPAPKPAPATPSNPAPAPATPPPAAPKPQTPAPAPKPSVNTPAPAPKPAPKPAAPAPKPAAPKAPSVKIGK